MNKTAFCANCQAETPHEITVDNGGELVLTCACGRAFKIPAGMSNEEMEDYLAAHKDSNEGQISLEESYKAAETLADPVEEANQ